jgi:hypothetical protein
MEYADDPILVDLDFLVDLLVSSTEVLVRDLYFNLAAEDQVEIVT